MNHTTLSFSKVLATTLFTTLFCSTVIASNGKLAVTPKGYVPVGSQLGGTRANVPMKHGSCGLDCGTHVLATKKGRLGIDYRFSMTCPSGKPVKYLAYQLQGQNRKVLLGEAYRKVKGKTRKMLIGPANRAAYSTVRRITPFSTMELEKACRVALGGNWAQPGSHKNTSKVVKKTIKESVRVFGQCKGWTNTLMRTYPVMLTLSCIDQSFYVPEG